MARWHERIVRLASRIEDGVDALRRRAPEGPARIAAYRGYGTAFEAFVAGRVLATTPESAASAEGWLANLRAAYRRLESDEVPAAQVRIRFAGTEQLAVADSEGYFRAWLRPRATLPDRIWHDVELDLIEPRSLGSVRATAQVLVPRPSATFGVISDLDDTVIRTHVTSPLRMLRQVLLESARSRLAFEGVASFYRALQRGNDGGRDNPIFYVSSSPWNLYDLLTEFLHLNEIPPGPLLLRDWGLNPNGTLPAGHREHKMAQIQQILATYSLPFILIGDSGQRDPEIYREVVAGNPDRILAVYIRDVTADPARRGAIRALAEELRSSGTPLVLSEDTEAAAQHAAEEGWITVESGG